MPGVFCTFIGQRSHWILSFLMPALKRGYIFFFVIMLCGIAGLAVMTTRYNNLLSALRSGWPIRCAVLISPCRGLIFLLLCLSSFSLVEKYNAPGMEVKGEMRLVDVDQHLLRNMNNLLSNAIKYSPPQRSIVLMVEFGRDIVRMSVTDSGGGVVHAGE
jgi:signal transduction histidine kinase